MSWPISESNFAGGGKVNTSKPQKLNIMKPFLFFFLSVLFAGQAASQTNKRTVTWTGAVDNNWNNAKNWSPDEVPNPCNQVIIPVVPSKRYPVLQSNIFVDNLTLQGGNLSTNQFNINYIKGNKGIQGIYYEAVASKTRIINDISYTVQTPGKEYSISRSISTCAPVYRFEIHPEDHWPSDLPDPKKPGDKGNEQNGQTKERVELSQANQKISFDQDTTIWISYSIFIEPGKDIVYRNVAYYCDLGQWHHSGSSGGPPWNFSLRGQDLMTLETRGHANVYSNGTLVPEERKTVVVTRGKWHNFVIRTRHSKGKTGLIEWWLDGELQCSVSGIGIGYNEKSIGYWKFGIYRTAASKGDRTDLAVRYANMEVSGNSLFSRVKSPLPVD